MLLGSSGDTVVPSVCLNLEPRRQQPVEFNGMSSLSLKKVSLIVQIQPKDGATMQLRASEAQQL